jgi:hypothetical protein
MPQLYLDSLDMFYFVDTDKSRQISTLILERGSTNLSYEYRGMY